MGPNLPVVLWTYKKTPHEPTAEKPLFLLFGIHYRTPTEAAYLWPSSVQPDAVNDYKEELMLSPSSAREITAANIQKAQEKYNKSYNRNANCSTLQSWCMGTCSFSRGSNRKEQKLSRPWHGPYRVATQTNPDVCVDKVYSPHHGKIRLHQSRVKPAFQTFLQDSTNTGVDVVAWLAALLSGLHPQWVNIYIPMCPHKSTQI